MQEMDNVKEKEQKRYSYPGGEAEAAKKRWISAGFTAVLSILFWLVGSYVCVGIGKDYVFLPWFVCVPPLVGCWLAVIKLLRCGECMTETDIKKGIGRMWRSSFLVAVGSGVSFLGSIWFLLEGTYTSFGMELGLVIRMGILCVFSVISMICHKKQESQLVETNC